MGGVVRTWGAGRGGVWGAARWGNGSGMGGAGRGGDSNWATGSRTLHARAPMIRGPAPRSGRVELSCHHGPGPLAHHTCTVLADPASATLCLGRVGGRPLILHRTRLHDAVITFFDGPGPFFSLVGPPAVTTCGAPAPRRCLAARGKWQPTPPREHRSFPDPPPPSASNSPPVPCRSPCPPAPGCPPQRLPAASSVSSSPPPAAPVLFHQLSVARGGGCTPSP